MPAVLRHLLQPAQVRAGDAAAEVLIADRRIEHGRAARPRRRIDDVTADYRAFDVFEDLLVRFVLVVMRIDVDDQEILIVADARLLRRVFEMFCGRVIVEVKLADFARSRIHDLLP